MLKRPDADYQLAFSVFDSDNSGSIDFDEFEEVLSQNIAASGIRTSKDAQKLTVAFDFDVPWMKLYVGRQGGSHVLACTLLPRDLAEYRQRVYPTHKRLPGRASAPGVPLFRQGWGRIHLAGRVSAHHYRNRRPQAVGLHHGAPPDPLHHGTRPQDFILRSHCVPQYYPRDGHGGAYHYACGAEIKRRQD